MGGDMDKTKKYINSQPKIVGKEEFNKK